MNPPTNTGSFGSVAGGISPELQAAISRRPVGNPSGPMGQTTQGAPTNNPSIQMPPTQPLPSGGVGQSVPSTVMGGEVPQGQGLPMNTPESELIIKALDSRLKSLSKIQGA